MHEIPTNQIEMCGTLTWTCCWMSAVSGQRSALQSKRSSRKAMNRDSTAGGLSESNGVHGVWHGEQGWNGMASRKELYAGLCSLAARAHEQHESRMRSTVLHIDGMRVHVQCKHTQLPVAVDAMRQRESARCRGRRSLQRVTLGHTHTHLLPCTIVLSSCVASFTVVSTLHDSL